MGSKNDPLNDALCRIVELYGEGVLSDANRVIALLKDYAPRQGKEIKLIALALKEGIGQKLLDAVTIDDKAQEQCMRNCMQQMVDDLYITDDAAQSAIMTIALALNFDAAKNANTGREEITLTSPVIITKGETVAYKGKIIHLQSSIHCEGNLVFEDCTLHCRELGTNYGVTLTETATLSVSKCTVRNYANSDVCFFACENGWISQSDAKNTVAMSFKHCEFIDCCTFIYGSVLMEHCHILNPGSDFINSGNFEVHIGASEFSLQIIPKFASKGDQIIRCSKLHFSECLVHGTPEEVSDKMIDYFIGSYAPGYFDVEHCIFRHLNYAIINNFSSTSIRLSVFNQCKNLSWGKINIEDCRFDGCAELSADGTIARCQFNPSIGNPESKSSRVISAFSGLQINNCEFNNWVGKNGEDMIRFSCYGGDKAEINQCIFRGMRAGDGFVIVGDGEKDSFGAVNVMNCKFINCTTERESGQIIRHYDTYFTLLGREKRVRTVDVQDCTGLDQVNSGGGVVDVILKTHTADGEIIGITDESDVGT